MDAATAEQPPMNEKKDAQQPPAELFRFSGWVHVGADAEECEARESGACENRRHFHAWCRLPNQFQHQDIRERALAAKARRIRQLRDPAADAYEVLEADMDELLRSDTPELLIDELVSKDWWKRHLEAMNEVDAREEYEHIERDRERIAEVRAMSEADRPQDEFDELERHLARYTAAVEQERDTIEQPLRASLQQLEKAELVEQIRQERVAAEGSSAFMDTYSKWEWLAGTFTTEDPIRRKLSFATAEQLESAAPEIVEALRTTYADLETALQRGVQGN